MKITIIAKSLCLHSYLLCLDSFLSEKVDLVYTLRECINEKDIGFYKSKVIALKSVEECIYFSDLIIVHNKDISLNTKIELSSIEKRTKNRFIFVDKSWDDFLVTNSNCISSLVDDNQVKSLPNILLISFEKTSLPFAGEILVYDTLIQLGLKVKPNCINGIISWLKYVFGPEMLKASIAKLALNNNDRRQTEVYFNHINIDAANSFNSLNELTRCNKPDFVILLTNFLPIWKKEAICKEIKKTISKDIDYIIFSTYSSLLVGKNQYNFFTHKREACDDNESYIDDCCMTCRLSNSFKNKLAFPDGMMIIK